MKRILLLSIIPIIAISGFFLLSSSKNTAQVPAEDNLLAKKWQKVDSLEKKGLYRMALTEVNDIFAYASENKNHNQVIKAVLYELKYNSYLEEDDYVLGIYKLNELIKKAPSPSKEILHSLTAEVYWGYYSSNSWKYADRSNVVEVELDDIRTWDLERIVEKVIYHYQSSLLNPSYSQSKEITDFKEIIYNEYMTTHLRPTLYDFLAYRAFEFYGSASFNVGGNVETFSLNRHEYFGTNKTFVAIQPNVIDSLNPKFWAINVMQQLTAFRAKKMDQKEALVHTELQRVKFINQHSTLENKEEEYLQALTRMTNIYKGTGAVAEVWYEIAAFYNNKGNSYSFNGDTTNRWSKKKAWEICKQTEVLGTNLYGVQQCQALRSQIELKSLQANIEQALIPNSNNRIQLTYKNIDKAFMKVVSYKPENYYKRNYKQKELIAELQKASPVIKKDIQLNDPGDFQGHSTELLLEPLEKGFYFLVLASNAEYNDHNEAFIYVPFWVTDITYKSRRNSDKTDIIVSSRTTGNPLVGAKVKVSYEKYNYINQRYEFKQVGTFTTDEEGFISVAKSGDYYNFFVEVDYEDDHYDPRASMYNYGYSNHTYNHVETRFFTDRKIYRPGQKIYFKGIKIEYRGDERKLVTNSSVTVTFKDVNGQVVSEQKLTTNEYGSFAGEFTAPFGVLTGQMTIADGNGSTYFRVEEYKRPKFKVDMKPIEGEFELNDSITAVGFAKAYAGNNIDGAAVKYRVTRTTNYYNRWWWSWWYPSTPDKEVVNGEALTDENGEFKVKFKAIPDENSSKKYLPYFTYTIYADVTDINGETHSSQTQVVVGYQSLMLSNNLPGEVENTESFQLKVYATNLNGSDVPAKGKITIHELKKPQEVFYHSQFGPVDMPQMNEAVFKAKFPKLPYGQEADYNNWEKGKLKYSTNFNTSEQDTFNLKDFSNWKPGIYVYEAVSKDKKGLEIIDKKYFQVYNRTAKEIPTTDVFWAKQIKYTVEPGEIGEILIGTADEAVTYMIEMEHNNEIISRDYYTLNKGQKLLKFPVEEKHRGNFSVHVNAIRANQSFNRAFTFNVPFSNKALNLSFETFRNKLLPGQDEEWIINIQNHKGGKEQAELLATLYDASLDALYTPNSFYMSIYNSFYARLGWGGPQGFGIAYGHNNSYGWSQTKSYPYRSFARLNYHSYSTYYYPRYRYYGGFDDGIVEGEVMLMETTTVAKGSSGRADKDSRLGNAEIVEEDAEVYMDEMPAPASEVSKEEVANNQQSIDGALGTVGPKEDLSNVSARTNFNETAFFYPQLTADANGKVSVKFTIPESLTEWRFLGLAHTKDLKIGTISEKTVTQKELMVVPNMPRFLREGDQITLSSKISNISEEDLEGQVELFLIDPFTEEQIGDAFKLKNEQQTFKVEKGKSTVVSWNLLIPYQLSAVKYKVVAKGGTHTDGEENVLPILTNRMLVTESMPMPIRGAETKTFEFEKLVKSGQSKTLRHHRYTLEFTSNPAWYALQAMPYMMEYPYECAEQTFTRFYSNSIAAHIMNSNPKIKKVIEDWGQNSPEAFLSNLQKNQELKSVMLEETPWVLNAKSEEQTKRNLSILMDMDRMSREMDKALGKIIKLQSANGGWPWFPGMRESRYITQHIVTGMGHLDHLGIKSVRENRKIWKMVQNAVQYLDQEIRRDYDLMLKYASNPDDQHIGYTQIQYLYARSYFPQIGMNKSVKEAVDYYKGQAEKYWLKFNIYAEGMIALAAHRFEMKELASDVVKSLKDRSIHHEEFGMYWKDYYVGYYWYEAPIETQALMIEMFDEVANDQESVEDLKVWLLKEKQTTHWKTTKQTTEAVYALLLKGTDLLANDELVNITVGGKPINYVSDASGTNPYDVKAEAGTGYFKTHWEGDNVTPKLGNITVSKKEPGVAWGAAYWQYFEDLDKITFAETNLKLNKQLFLVEVTPQGEKIKPVNDNNVVHVGDKLRVRIELRTDRNLEYVHMKDMRSSGFEPMNVLSRYYWRDGLGYYQATKDAATNFFFDYIPKGTYVFEYDLRVAHKGDFSNGITTIQCMYAPEFTSHSEGIRVHVE